MSESESWGATTSEAAESSDAYVPKEQKPKRRKSNKKTFNSDSDTSPVQPRRRSPRRKSSTKSNPATILNLDGSSDEDENQENTAIVANIPLNPRRRSRSSSTKRRKSSERENSNNSTRRKSKESKEKKKKIDDDEEEYEPTSAMDIEDDADDEDEEETESAPAPKKRGRKRKLSEAELDEATDPPPKKQRTSTSSNTNTNTNNSKAKTTKKSNKGKNDKKKKKTYKGSDATEQIRRKMLESNRPWTASALRTEMMESIGGATIKKSLAELKEEGILSMREFGKKKSKTLVYWADQDGNSDDEYDEMETKQRIQELEEMVKQKRSELNRIKNKCQNLQKEPTDVTIKAKMEEAFKNLQLAQKNYANLAGDESQRMTQDDVEDILCKANVYLKAWKERMGKVWDMINMMFQDSAEKPDKLLTKKCGGELDKENGVDWNDYKEMYKQSRIVVQRRKDDKKSKR